MNNTPTTSGAMHVRKYRPALLLGRGGAPVRRPAPRLFTAAGTQAHHQAQAEAVLNAAAGIPRPLTPHELLIGGNSIAKRRTAADHDRVLRLAGWAPMVTKDLVTYTPPATATAAEIEATKAAARAIRIRDGWASERA